jgi:hypothetical protein
MIPDMNLDQTQFMAESPLLKDGEMSVAAEVVLSAEELKKKKLKKIVIATSAFLLIVLIILLVIKARSVEEDEQIVETEEIKLTEVVVGPFNQRLSELKNELEIADPNQEDLPFPPIDDEISLDE